METVVDIVYSVAALIRFGVSLTLLACGAYVVLLSLIYETTPFWMTRTKARPIDLAFGLLMIVAGLAVLVA